MAEAKKKTTKKAAKEAELIVEVGPLKADQTEKTDSLIEEIEEPAEKPAAKAGKRSPKARAADEEKQARQSRKVEDKKNGVDEKPQPAAKTHRSRAERAGKKYREAAKLIEKSKAYSLSEALSLATKTNPVKFDASVEMHINLGVDPKVADQNVRDTVVMPAGTGKKLRIAVLAEDEDAQAAKVAGADITDADKILADLEAENIEFDILISIPSMMAQLGKYARLLGPRGLMPNPKSGTVTTNIATAVAEAKAGKVEYRVDQAGIIHMAIGKASFTPDRLLQNAEAVMSSVRAAKPASLKNIYIKSVYVSTSMGPSIKVEISS